MALGPPWRGHTRLPSHIRSIRPPALGRVPALALWRVARILPWPPWAGAVSLWRVALVWRVAWPLLGISLRVAVAIGRDTLPRLVHVGRGAHLWLPRVALGPPGTPRPTH